MIDDTFEEGTQDWRGAIENENGRLKVKVLNRYSGTYKEIDNVLSKDEELEIKLTVDTYTTTVPIRVLISERDAENNSLGWYYVGRAENGSFIGKHKIKKANTASIYLKLDIEETLDIETEFYIDNVTVNTGRVVIKEEKNYYPFGSTQKGYNNLIIGRKHNYGYNNKEEQAELGLDWYDFGARNYDAALGRWMNIDPLAESFISLTQYNAMVNNPISYIDPDGKFSTNVTKNEDGTHTVAEGGDPNDGDNNIYVVDSDGNRTGEIIGESLTSHSFYLDDGSAVVGAIIDSNSTDGQDFIDNEIIEGNPGLFNYMLNATGGKKYDYKTNNIDKRSEGVTETQYKYRGSKTSNGKIGSARDFGNMGTGIVTARKGIPYASARLSFDALETYQKSSMTTIGNPKGAVFLFPGVNLSQEGIPTQKAEALGFGIGQSIHNKELKAKGTTKINRVGE